MLISRETWQKVLRWNSLFPAILVMAVLGSVPSAAAEEPVVLKRGPVEVRGIDPLPRNAHAAFYGEYTYKEVLIEVYFTYTKVYRPESLPLTACPVYNVYALPSEEDRPAFIYQDPGDWTLVARFSGNLDYCEFLTELIRKLVYFQGISRGIADFSFPAVLKLEG